MTPDPFPTALDPAGRTLGAEELAALTTVIASARLNASLGGTMVTELERGMGRLYGVEHAVACSSGTAALHLAVAAVDPEPGDEIIVPPLTDFGSVIPILAQNAVPVFADVDALTGQLSPQSVRACLSERTRAIIAVHLFGGPAPVAELRALADEQGLVLIEDCAQAYLTTVPGSGRLAGTLGHIGCFSLQQYKHITCGDGGLAITADPVMARRMRLFGDKGWPRDSGTRDHLFLGLNYRMTELQGAVAQAQLPKLADVVASRRERAGQLRDALVELPGVSVPAHHEHHSYWFFPVVLDPEAMGGENHEVARALRAAGIPANAGYLTQPLYCYPVLSEGRTYGRSRFPLTCPPARKEWRYELGLCPSAERLIDHTLVAVAWNEHYSPTHVDRIADAFRTTRDLLTG